MANLMPFSKPCNVLIASSRMRRPSRLQEGSNHEASETPTRAVYHGPVMTPDDLATLMRSALPHAVLDIRERATYEKGHIYRATSMPRRLIESRLPALVPARGIRVVLYDADGTLAALTLPTLAAM